MDFGIRTHIGNIIFWENLFSKCYVRVFLEAHKKTKSQGNDKRSKLLCTIKN